MTTGMQAHKILPWNDAADRVYHKYVKGKPIEKKIPKHAALTREEVIEVRRLFYFENKTRKEIASILGKEYSTVTSAINRNAYESIFAPFEKIVRRKVVIDYDYYKNLMESS